MKVIRPQSATNKNFYLKTNKIQQVNTKSSLISPKSQCKTFITARNDSIGLGQSHQRFNSDSSTAQNQTTASTSLSRILSQRPITQQQKFRKQLSHVIQKSPAASQFQKQLAKDLAELGECELQDENKPKFKIQLSGQGSVIYDYYQKYELTHNHQIKIPDEDPLQNQYISTPIKNPSKLKNAIEYKFQQINPSKVVEKLASDVQNKVIKYNPKQLFYNQHFELLQDIREKSMQSLSQALENNKNKNIVEIAKQNLDQVIKETNDFLFKQSYELEQLKQEVSRYQRDTLELKNINDNLQRKNQMLEYNLNQIKSDIQKTFDLNAQISQFKQHFEQFNEAYPNQSLTQFIAKYEQLEQKLHYQLQKVQDIELESDQKLKENDQNIKKLKDKIVQLENDNIEKNKSIDHLRKMLYQKQNENEFKRDFKNEYISLCNKVIELYQDWNKKIPLYSKIEENPIELKDPDLLIDFLKQYTKINTNEKQQEYLRKIIVSVHQLQRKFFPSNVNERFDPEKVYQRVIKLIDQLQTSNKKLKEEISNQKSSTNKT